jgi:hypothetical protein
MGFIVRAYYPFMENPRKKIIHNRLYLTYGICALLVYAFLMVFIMPWWDASNHPLEITLGSGTEENLLIEYAKDGTTLPLVSIGEESGYFRKYATELPPRPSYDLVMIFPEGSTGSLVLKKVEVIRLLPEKDNAVLTLTDVALPGEGVRIQQMADGVRLFAEPGGRLALPVEMPDPTPYAWLLALSKATFGYIVVAFALFFGVLTFAQFPDCIQGYRRSTPLYECVILLIFAVIGSLIHTHLVGHAMPNFAPGESDAFVEQAILIQNGGASDFLNKARSGYAYFLGKVASPADWSMAAVAEAQAWVFCLCLMLLGFAMIRLIKAFILGPFLLLALISPPAVWSSIHIGPESLIASSWILSIAAFLFLWQRERWQRWVGIVAFGCSVLWAITISASGFLLFVLPAGLLSGAILWGVITRGANFWKLEVIWKTVGQVSVPLGIVLLVGLFLQMPGSPFENLYSSPERKASAPFTTGMFEVSSLGTGELYEAVIRERAVNGYQFDGPAMSAFPGLADKSAEALPARAMVMAWGRLSIWGLFLPNIETYSGHPLLSDFALGTRFKSPKQATAVQESLTRLMRDTGQLVHVQERRSNRQIYAYNKTVGEIYRWLYRVLLMGGLVGWMIGLADRKSLATVLVLPYLINILYHVLFMDIGSHWIQSLDAFLWLGALSGLLCINPKALQKPTDETDRRTMQPIRPKRLFTRQRVIPGMPKD